MSQDKQAGIACRRTQDLLPEYAAGRAMSEDDRIAAHLATCAACATIERELRDLFAQLAAAPAPPVSAEGEARARQALRASLAEDLAAHRGGSGERRRWMTVRLAAAAALTAVLIALANWQSSRDPGAAVEAAVQQANTWHLRGWKILGGRRTEWEIWGRRSPFFYREQSGDELNLDDGTQRIRTVSPFSPNGKRFAVRVASAPAPTDQWRSLLTEGTGWTHMKPWRQDRTTVTFRIGWDDGKPKPYIPYGDYYIIDRRTWLPLHYEYRSDTTIPPRVVSTLTAQYDVPLPASVTTLRLPPDVTLIDTLAPLAPGTLPTEDVARAHGLTLQMTPLAMDRNGNILARARCWLGGVKLGDWQSPLGYDLDYDHMRYGMLIRDGKTGWAHDTPYRADNGAFYIELERMLRWTLLPNGDGVMIFAPLDPLRKGAPLPGSLRLKLVLSPNVRARNSEYTAFFRQPLELTMALPAQPQPLDLDRYFPGWRRANGEIPLAVAIDRERAAEELNLGHLQRSVEWSKAGFAQVPPFSDAAQQFRLDLARGYDHLGDSRRAEQVYREIIQVAGQHPETQHRFAWEARKGLRTPAPQRARQF